MSSLFNLLRTSRRASVAALGALACASWLLTSCGGGMSQASNTGGNGSGGIGSGGTGSYTNGPISGLGSIIVNGVRYDVSQAQVIDDQGVTHTTSALMLGMVVEVSSGTVSNAAASAGQVRYGSALLGPVDTAPDSSCSCLMALGQKVVYSALTVMPTDLAGSDVVEVYGQPDLAQHALVATRIERVGNTSLPFKLVGQVSASSVDATGLLLTVSGPTSDLVLSYGSASDVQAVSNLGASTATARAWFNRTGGVHRLLTSLRVDTPLVSDRDEASLDGLVTQLIDGQGMLGVNGTLVKVLPAASTAAQALTLGQRVRVEGSLVGGVLQVSEVHTTVDSGGDIDDDDDVELHGWPSQVPIYVSADLYSMIVRGVTVVYHPSQVSITITTQTCVEVKGQSYDDQGRLVATQVEADNTCHADGSVNDD